MLREECIYKLGFQLAVFSPIHSSSAPEEVKFRRLAVSSYKSVVK